MDGWMENGSCRFDDLDGSCLPSDADLVLWKGKDFWQASGEMGHLFPFFWPAGDWIDLPLSASWIFFPSFSFESLKKGPCCSLPLHSYLYTYIHTYIHTYLSTYLTK